MPICDKWGVRGLTAAFLHLGRNLGRQKKQLSRWSACFSSTKTWLSRSPDADPIAGRTLGHVGSPAQQNEQERTPKVDFWDPHSLHIDMYTYVHIATNGHAGRGHKVYILNMHDFHLKAHFAYFYINFSLTPLNSYIFVNKNFQTYIEK